jgi:hypothetical protein
MCHFQLTCVPLKQEVSVFHLFLHEKCHIWRVPGLGAQFHIHGNPPAIYVLLGLYVK